MAKPKMKVSLRGGFSDRNGIKPENIIIQYEQLDDRSRTALYNVLNRLYCELFSYNSPYHYDEQDFIKHLYSELYCQEIDYSKTYSSERCLEVMKETMIQDDYDSVLTLLEFVFKLFDTIDRFKQYDATDKLNYVLKKEYVGYRYSAGLIVPITNEDELAALSIALDSQNQNVAEHLKKAAHLLSDRNIPDYENSIKESITGVEALCEAILGEKGTLAQCLNKLKSNGVEIHAAMEEAFKKLYGYTSDATGIRHAGDLDGPEATFAEAKYMLVSCSAFINYLQEISIR